MTNTYDEYADKAAARYLQGRMDEQAAWVEAVKAAAAEHRAAALEADHQWVAAIDTGDLEARDDWRSAMVEHNQHARALDALLRRMGVE